MSSPSPQLRWYAAWAVVVLILLALPIVVFTTRDATSASAQATSSAASSAGPSASPTPAASAKHKPGAKDSPPVLGDVPLCADVWQVGRTLPADYVGCQRAGKVQRPRADHCLLSYRDRWWARKGQDVRESKDGTAEDKVYAAARARC